MAPETALTPEAALAEIADVARAQHALRARFEGITWVLWGLVAALQALTLGLIDDVAAASTAAHVAALGSHLWILLGIAASVGIWRAAAVHFDPAIAPRRALAFFIGWPAAFSVATYLATRAGAGHPFAFAVVAAVLLFAFALVNPVRFTATGRWLAALLGVVASAVALVVWTYGDPGHLWYGLVGGSIGLTWVVGGLYALYRG